MPLHGGGGVVGGLFQAIPQAFILSLLRNTETTENKRRISVRPEETLRPAHPLTQGGLRMAQFRALVYSLWGKNGE